MVQHVTVVFLVVLIGYCFLSRSNLYRHRLLKDSNYAVLYESAIAGGMFFVLVWVTLNGLKLQFFDCTSLTSIDVKSCWIENRYPLPQLDVLVLASTVATLLVLIGNLVYSREKVGLKVAKESGLVGRTILEALEGHQLIQINTVRNKVYIGWILTGPGMSQQGKVEDVAIVPLYGGFRSQESQRIVLNVNYSTDVRSYERRLKESDLDSPEHRQPDLSVVIPMGEIALIKRPPTDLDEALVRIRDDPVHGRL